MKVAWGITGSGDYMPEIVKTMKDIAQNDSEVKIYIFLSKAADKVVKWYALFKDLKDITDKIYTEVDSNTTEPFYYIPGALQVGKFDFFIVCPATGNTVAKIVSGIADTLITNSVAQAAKANIPIYIMPVDHVEGKQVTTLPSGEKLELEMRGVDLENTSNLSKMRGIRVFYSPTEIDEIIKKYSR
ncbi:MAG: archaeoflavoprotein AfpA [Candidatus Bathyarchaeota archaeon]|nr:archaeoflavoprotein AfpA [Candidatus Bathyarchaeota archaeon]